MTASQPNNFHSLSLVKDELIATIEAAAQDLETFVSSLDEDVRLQACINGIKQILGILQVIQLEGAILLTEELLANANEITVGDSGKVFEKRLEIISNTFFILSRYLEYVQQTETTMPVLLIPHINELRKLRQEALLPESYFFEIRFKNELQLPTLQYQSVSDEELGPLLGRIRQMYQVGLLGILKNQQTKSSLQIMRRALIRLQRLGAEDQPLTVLWWMAATACDVFVQQNMDILQSRKILFSRIDRVIRQVQQGRLAAYQANAPKGLLKELVYLLMLSGHKGEMIDAVKNNIVAEALPYTDQELSKERQSLSGPSVHTVSSLARVLQVELLSTKKVLENADQMGSRHIEDIEAFIQTLEKVAEILSVVGLSAPANVLKEEIERVRAWPDSQDGPDAIELQDVANTLLYVESTVASLESAKLSDDKLALANTIALKEVVATGELQEAGRIVLQESEAGLSLTKRALSAYSDSNFDPGHIRNIGKTLATVRGGMLMLKRYRAAAVLSSCADFVEEVLSQPEHPAALKELLETFADAIISIEYYIDAARTSSQVDDSVLQVAEESLAALGHPVSDEYDENTE